MEGQAQPLFYALNDMIVCKLTVKQHIMMHLMQSVLVNGALKLLPSRLGRIEGEHGKPLNAGVF